MTFQLDTTGAVGPFTTGGPAPAYHLEWCALSPFTQGYVEALFAGIIEGETVLHGDLAALDDLEEWSFTHLTPEALARIIADCEAFRASTKTYAITHKLAGREFWEDRQAGLIDALPPLTVQLGDDGKVRFAKDIGEAGL